MVNPVMLTGVALVTLGIGRQEVTIGVGILLIVLAALKVI